MTPTTMASYTGRRLDVIALIPREVRRCLDVGCSNGALGHELKRRTGASVWGIDRNPALAAAAATRLDRVICSDADRAIAAIAAERFDCVICADVLEHLADPLTTLVALRDLLSAGGACVVSLPNVRFYETFVQLGLKGTWPKRDRGVFDRTHLRWFTDRDAREMFAEAGLTVAASSTAYRLRDRPGRVNRLARPLAQGPLRPLLAYQHLYLLVRASISPLRPAGTGDARAARLRRGGRAPWLQTMPTASASCRADSADASARPGSHAPSA